MQRHVLSLSGGGIRGVIQAVILSEIERMTGKRIADLFDLMVGTSTGGILAAALSSPKGYSAADLVKMYTESGPTIFSKSPWRTLESAGGLSSPKYNFRGLVQVLMKYHGVTTLDKSTTKTMLTSYNATLHKGQYFKSWKDSVSTVTACRCTSAAPTYFAPEIFSGCAIVDGGLGVNNPAMSAYAEALRLFPGDDIKMLSIGTGDTTRPVKYEEAKDWGAAEWVMPLLNCLFNAQETAVDYQMRQILGSSYLYLQGSLTEANDDIDDASRGNLKNLIAHAHKVWDEFSGAVGGHFDELTTNQ